MNTAVGYGYEERCSVKCAPVTVPLCPQLPCRRGWDMVLCKYIVACLVLCIAFASMHALLASLAVFREAVKPHCLSDCTAGPSVPAHPTNSSRPTFLETTPQPDPPRLFLPGPHDPAEGGEEPEPDPAFIPEEETEEQPEEGPEYCAAWLERLRTGGDPPEAVRDGLPRNMTYVVESHYRQWSDTRDHLATRFAQDAMPSGLRLLRALGTLLPQLVSFLEHHHIAYWLDWGTLLGSWRYKDFIPWDRCVPRCAPPVRGRCPGRAPWATKPV